MQVTQLTSASRTSTVTALSTGAARDPGTIPFAHDEARLTQKVHLGTQ